MDIVIHAGHRIGPFDVEDALVGQDVVAVAESIASPDEERGNGLEAYVVLADANEGSDALVAGLQSYVKAEASSHTCPRRVKSVAELPKTASGKTRRQKRREAERETHDE